MKRGSVIFDECGFLSAEMLKVYGAFAAVNKNFASGKDRDGRSLDPIRLKTIAINLPNQKFILVPHLIQIRNFIDYIVNFPKDN